MSPPVLNNLAELVSPPGLAMCRCRAALQAQPGDLEKVLGPEHPDVALSLNNLAELYRERYADGAALPAQPGDQEKVLEHPMSPSASIICAVHN